MDNQVSKRRRLAVPLCSASWYQQAPTLTTTLEHLEHLALDRVRLLKNRTPYLIADTGKEEEEITGYATNASCATNETSFGSQCSSIPSKDATSHWLLRLAACANEKLSTWWVKRETEIFRQRLEHMIECEDMSSVQHLLEQSTLKYTLCRFDEHDMYGRYNPQFYSDEHTAAHEGARHVQWVAWWKQRDSRHIADTVAVKVPFENAIHFFRHRNPSVLLQKGYAIVMLPLWIQLLSFHFQANLKKELIVARRTLPTLHIVEETRMAALITRLHKHMDNVRLQEQNRGAAAQLSFSTNATDRIRVQDLDSMAHLFPPCAKALHYELRTTHHLKYESRMVYWMFLKGIGITVDEQQEHTKQEFLKTLSLDKIDSKRYLYSIRHLYGLEGMRKNKNPLSCQKIIDTYGSKCPFHSGDTKKIVDIVTSMGVTQQETRTQRILAFRANGRPQKACGQTFAGHPLLHDRIAVLRAPSQDTLQFTSPNEYFAAALHVIDST